MAFANHLNADSQPAIGEYLLHCSICFERFTKPKILPCLHTFCLDCISRHYGVYKQMHSGRLVCPTCRDLIQLPKAGVVGLQDDLTVNKIRDFVKDLHIQYREDDKEENKPPEDVKKLTQGDIDTKKNLVRERITELNSKMLLLKKQIHRLHILDVNSKSPTEKDGLKKSDSKGILGRNTGEEKLTLLQNAGFSTEKRMRKERDRLFNDLAEIKCVHDVLDDVLENASGRQLRELFDNLLKTALDVLSRFPYIDDIEPEENGAAGGASIDTAQDLSSQIRIRPKGAATKPPKKKKVKTAYTKTSTVSAYQLYSIGKMGTKPGEFDYPVHSWFLRDGSLLVSDKNNDRIQLVETNGEIGRVILKNKVKPRRAILNPDDGLLYVSDEMTQSIRVFDAEGRPIRIIGKGFFTGVAGMAMASNNRVVMTDAEQCFITIHTSSGELFNKFTSRILSDTVIPNPCYCVVDEEDRIIVSDFRNRCIKFFEMSGKPLFTIKIECPRGLALDNIGNLFVADGDNHRIAMFSHEGKFIQDVLTAADGIRFPSSVAIGPTGQLAVTQFDHFYSHELLVFQLKYSG